MRKTAEETFSSYLDQNRPQAERAYLRTRVFPALDALNRRAVRCHRAHLWLTAAMGFALAALVLLLLLPYPLPTDAQRLAGAGLGLAAAGALFAQQLLRLPAQGFSSAWRAQQLSTLLHAYFLGTGIFAESDADARLQRLCAEVESLLSCTAE